MIYLDHAAATPLDDDVLSAMTPYFSNQFYNPSATYAAARTVHNDLQAARGRIANWLGARSSEIIFTAGGTESDNLAIDGVMAHYPEANLVVSVIEHDAVLAPAARYDCRTVPVDSKGMVDPVAVTAMVDDETVLVSVMYANNEVGSIQPIRRIAQELAAIRTLRRKAGNMLPLYFHTDACQATNYLDLHAARLGVDLMTINGSKLYGPKQSGALYAGSHVELTPVIRGGGQERNLRSGTENVAACIGLAAALDKAQSMRADESKRLNDLQQLAFQLIGQRLPGAAINGSLRHRLPNNIHMTLPGFDNERLLVQLDERGILAAAGSACSASSDEPSHVLRAMGISGEDAQASLRFTMGRATAESDIDVLIDALHQLTR